MAAGLRFIAQRITTGEFLDMEVPFTLNGAPRRDLSGPGAMSGTVPADYARSRGLDGEAILAEWSTAMYAEMDGEIVWGGLLITLSWGEGVANVEFAGFTTYPHGIPFLGTIIARPKLTPRDPERPPIDAYDVVRTIWRHVQAHEGGDLGIEVVTDKPKSGVLLGKFSDEPYELVWWELPDCGAEFDLLAEETPFDYAEEHYWSGNEIKHRLVVEKRIGRRRGDLRFMQGENLTDVLTPEYAGDEYANEIFAVGKGEGRSMLHQRVPTPPGKRLRRVRTFTDKTIGSKARLIRLARREQNVATQSLSIPMISVRDHPNAPVGSWRPGDDILVQAEVPWIGEVAIWHRVVSDEFNPDGTAVLTLRRTDWFA